MSTEERYKHRIFRDLKKAGLPTDFKLDLRGYSKSLDGTYNPNTKVVIVYAREADGVLRDYDEILEIALHEAVHHYQWNYEKGFVRRRGIMHNAKFHKKYNECMSKLEEVFYDTSTTEIMEIDNRLFI